MTLARYFNPTKTLFIGLFLAAILIVSGCTNLSYVINRAKLKPKGLSAQPEIVDANARVITSLGQWETARLFIQEQLQKYVYGTMPDQSSISIKDRTVIDKNAFEGSGTLEEITMTATATFADVANESKPFIIELITPNNQQGPVPVILMQSFSPRWSAIRHPGVSHPDNIDPEENRAGGLITFVFGRYVEAPPVKDILDRGYAVALVYPSEFVPDRGLSGLQALAALSQGHEDDQSRWGSIAAWGWGFSRMIDALEQDPRFAKDGFITYGHSRYGKSALVAAAFDPRISAVISHQSGTGGASLSKEKKGESIEEITNSYPHWFSKTYAAYAGREIELPLDQHYLLALVAPRPLLLGNARRDTWSDPNGALKAAIGASSIWGLYPSDAGHVRGLQQEKLKPFLPEADIALWIRPGTHGVVKEDWPAFLQFLDAHIE